jgi:hypothetical protein
MVACQRRVFGDPHGCVIQSMIRKSGYRFSEKIMLNKKIERDDDSKKNHHALVSANADWL